MPGGEDAKKKHKRPSGGGGERRSSGEGRRSSGEGDKTASPTKSSTSNLRQSRSKSPSTRTAARKAGSNKDALPAASVADNKILKNSVGAAPKKPTRMGSGVSANVYSSKLGNMLGADSKNNKPFSSRDAEEQSLGDFTKYQGGKLGAGLLGNLNASQQSFVPEESLGSFTGFIKKYQQEELLGLHDKPEAFTYEQQLKKPKQQIQRLQKPDASMGDIMNPMKQYGGPATTATRQAPNNNAEDSLGSFALFADKYEKDKLLGLQDSELSAPPIAWQNNDEPDIPEESMDVLELLGGGGDDYEDDDDEPEPELKKPPKKEQKSRKSSYCDMDIDTNFPNLADSDLNDRVDIFDDLGDSDGADFPDLGDSDALDLGDIDIDEIGISASEKKKRVDDDIDASAKKRVEDIDIDEIGISASHRKKRVDDDIDTSAKKRVEDIDIDKIGISASHRKKRVDDDDIDASAKKRVEDIDIDEIGISASHRKKRVDDDIDEIGISASSENVYDDIDEIGISASSEKVYDDIDEIGISASSEKVDTDDDGHDDDDDENFTEIKLPSSRVEKLAKKHGGLGYKIMVDTPGGHSPQPMKIVVAIEFEDETDSEDDGDKNRKENPQEVVARLARERIQRKSGGDYFAHVSGGEEDSSEEDSTDNQSKEENVNFLAGQMNRWNHSSNGNLDGLDARARLNSAPSSKPRDPSAAPPSFPERNSTNHSRSTNSTHSTLSSITVESTLHIQTDSCPSNQHVIQRQPVRRPSDAQKGSFAPHNLGTRRGLMLRQMSEASMKSSMSNDSSWVGSTDAPGNGYEASFMQLNLLDLNQTQMQSNDEVEQAILPDALPSGMENIPEDEEEEDQETIPTGKEPQVASQELLGMKGMLKHIKRVAPKRTRSFDFDRETPKAVWNSLFARSQKNELPGSQFVCNDESTEHDDDNHVLQGNAEEPAPSPDVDQPNAGEQVKKTGFMSTIKRVTGSTAKTKDEKEKSSSRGKSSLWSSMAIKTVIKPKEKNQGQEVAEDEASLGSHPEDPEQKLEDHENDDYEEDSLEEEEDLEAEEHSDDASDHSEGRKKRRHRSVRGTRTTKPLRRAGPARNRAKNSTNLLHQSLSDALDFYSVEQEDSGGEEVEVEVSEPVEPQKEDDEEAGQRKSRPRRKLPNRTRSDESGPTRTLPSRTRSSDGLRAPPGRTRSTPADSSPTRPVRTKSGFDDKGRPKSAKAMPRRTKSTPEGKERPTRSHDKGVSVRHRAEKVKPLKLNKPPVNLNPEFSGHSRALQLPEDATEEQLRDLLDYH